MPDNKRRDTATLMKQAFLKKRRRAKHSAVPRVDTTIQKEIQQHQQKEEAANEYAVSVTEEVVVKATSEISKLPPYISNTIRDFDYPHTQEALDKEDVQPQTPPRENSKQAIKAKDSKSQEIRERKPAEPKTVSETAPVVTESKNQSRTYTASRSAAAKQVAEYGRNKFKKEAQKKAAESSRQAAKKSAEWSQKAGKAIVRTVKAVISYIANTFGIIGIIVLLLAIILIGIILASPLGILFANAPSSNAVPLSSAVSQINMELNRRLNALQSEEYTSVEVVGSPPSWIEVIAVFASYTAGAEGGVDVASLTPDRVSILETVFWQMCYITSSVETVTIPDSDPDDGIEDSRTEEHLIISILSKGADDMREIYGFTDYQNKALDLLLSPTVNLSQLISSVTIDDDTALELLDSLPADLSPERRAVVQQALSLVGKVNYFWGGKSLVLGWDSRWGQLTKVSATGSPTTGTYRPFGLDCSGFVDWVFYNVSGGSYVIGQGGGVSAQHRNCTEISWGEAQPGDLVFYPDDSHIGIVALRDVTGNLLIVHCASGRNNVVITDSSGFMAVGSPVYYS